MTISLRVALLLVFLAACASCLTAQTPIKQAHPPGYYTLDEILNRKAALPNAAGIRDYSDYLSGALVSERAGKAYVDSFSHRLAKAEQLTRQGKGHLVPEADVVKAYNRLMKRIGAPSSFQASVSDMRMFRAHSVDVAVLPAILTANRNGTLCNPGEAVYLLVTLLNGSGKIQANYLDSLEEMGRDDVHGQMVVASSHSMYDDSQGRLMIYSLQHKSKVLAKLFEEVATKFHL